MDTYIVFTYQFSPIIKDSPSLFEKDDVDPMASMQRKNYLFQEILDDDSLLISYRNSHYRRRILFSKEGIVVFRLANNKYLRIEEDFQSNRIQNYPSIKIIVDNRDDKQRILIEHRIGAFYDEKFVARILQNSFRQKLLPHHLNITINREFQESEFWDIVSGCEKGIEKIRFSFPYPNLSRVRDKMKELVSEINGDTNSKDTKLELNSVPGEVLSVKKESAALSGLVEASAGSGQGIVIKAKGVKYQQVVGETKKTLAIDEFEGGFPEMIIERLIDKLDSI